jgi:hypothetical protein
MKDRPGVARLRTRAVCAARGCGRSGSPDHSPGTSAASGRPGTLLEARDRLENRTTSYGSLYEGHVSHACFVNDWQYREKTRSTHSGASYSTKGASSKGFYNGFPFFKLETTSIIQHVFGDITRDSTLDKEYHCTFKTIYSYQVENNKNRGFTRLSITKKT